MRRHHVHGQLGQVHDVSAQGALAEGRSAEGYTSRAPPRDQRDECGGLLVRSRPCFGAEAPSAVNEEDARARVRQLVQQVDRRVPRKSRVACCRQGQGRLLAG